MQEEDPYDAAWWTSLDGTPAAFEGHRIRQGEPWTVCALAGLQYHSWLTDDGLDGRHEPQPGDRLHLVSEPHNMHDGNAIRAEWRNGVMLGHLPRTVAADTAAHLDAGTPLRAYVIDTGGADLHGRAWSMRALLVGEPVRSRFGRWTTAAAERLDADLFSIVPTAGKRAAAAAWDSRLSISRLTRQAASAAAFAILAPARPPLPEGADQAPDPVDRARRFTWWDQVPPTLMTATTLARHGLRPGGEPFASIAYGRNRRARRYDLYAVAEARLIRERTNAQRAATAEAAVLRKGRRCPAMVL